MKTKTILVPIDFSAVSRAVVAEAAYLARLGKGHLVLLHVVQPPAFVADYGIVFDTIGTYTDAAERSADRHLKLLRTKLEENGVSAEAVRVTGSPAQCILELAKKRSASYIVIGSHGHTAFYDLMVGSTTSGVLKRATCPVIVVPFFKRAPRKAKR
jgi:nucleotide-binding universal stress UspA family protein